MQPNDPVAATARPLTVRLAGVTRAELDRHDIWINCGTSSRSEVVDALVWAAPDDDDTFREFVRLGRLRRLQATGQTFSAESLADLEERFA